MIEEIWKDIPGYEGLYQASNTGKIKSLPRFKRKNEVILQPAYNKFGYADVVLCKNGLSKTKRVYRLVLDTFVPNPDNLPCINHIDCNPRNNRLDNLEWCTYLYNNQYIHKMGRFVSGMKGKKGAELYNARAVNQFDLEGNFIRRFESASSVSEIGLKGTSVIGVCRNRRKMYANYQWRYTEDRPPMKYSKEYPLKVDKVGLQVIKECLKKGYPKIDIRNYFRISKSTLTSYVKENQP